MTNHIPYTLITGASSGIGKATAELFAKKGKNLILVARNTEKLKTLKIQLQDTFPTILIDVFSIDLSLAEKILPFYQQTKSYFIETWINNAGLGLYEDLAAQSLERTQSLLQLNIATLTLLSILYIQDYENVAATQLINISSVGGYTIVPTAITYCATKFFVSSFTEGAALELKQKKAALQIKVLAPAATQTNFGNVANGIVDYNYHQAFRSFHTSQEMAGFLWELFQSNQTVGYVDRETMAFILCEGRHPHSFHSASNQKIK